jgi:antitoxin component YwqK of YwqJK toxin-antitoxin module
VTITETYENGLLQGPTTVTYPHSQTVEISSYFNQGEKVKEIRYNAFGMPVEEWVQLSPTRYSLSMWYKEGSPMLVEEYTGEELLEGQYYTTNNEVESRVEKGHGLRIRRDETGSLVSKEMFEEGYALKKETYYPNGTPESIAYYFRNKLNGERKTFAQNGEPLAVEEYVNGDLHGKATYFKNGNRYLEISYLYGQKNGTERHYLDGDVISQEISWENDLKHGATIFYVDGNPEYQWYYSGNAVSKRSYDENSRLDRIIANLPEDSGNDGMR